MRPAFLTRAEERADLGPRAPGAFHEPRRIAHSYTLLYRRPCDPDEKTPTSPQKGAKDQGGSHPQPRGHPADPPHAPGPAARTFAFLPWGSTRTFGQAIFCAFASTRVRDVAAGDAIEINEKKTGKPRRLTLKPRLRGRHRQPRRREGLPPRLSTFLKAKKAAGP